MKEKELPKTAAMRPDRRESSKVSAPKPQRRFFKTSALPYVLLGVLAALSLPLGFLFASAGQISHNGESNLFLFAIPAIVVVLGFAALDFLVGRD